MKLVPSLAPAAAVPVWQALPTMPTDREKAGDRNSYLFSGRCPPPSSFSPPSFSPSHSSSSAPSHLCFPPNTAQTGLWRLEGKEAPSAPELPIVLCTLLPAGTLAQIPARPFLLGPFRQHTYLPPISIAPHPSLSLSGLWSTPLDLSPKMAPRTLHTGPAAAQAPGQRLQGPPPPSRVFTCLGVRKIFAPSLCRGWGAGSPLPPKPSLLTAEEGNGEDGTIQVQRHGAGGSGWSRALAGEGAPSAAARGCIGEGAADPSLSVSADPRPHTQPWAFILGPARFGLLPPLPPGSSPQNLRKTAAS